MASESKMEELTGIMHHYWRYDPLKSSRAVPQEITELVEDFFGMFERCAVCLSLSAKSEATPPQGN